MALSDEGPPVQKVSSVAQSLLMLISAPFFEAIWQRVSRGLAMCSVESNLDVVTRTPLHRGVGP
jgi:hypothetical protein